MHIETQDQNLNKFYLLVIWKLHIRMLKLATVALLLIFYASIGVVAFTEAGQ